MLAGELLTGDYWRRPHCGVAVNFNRPSKPLGNGFTELPAAPGRSLKCLSEFRRCQYASQEAKAYAASQPVDPASTCIYAEVNRAMGRCDPSHKQGQRTDIRGCSAENRACFTLEGVNPIRCDLARYGVGRRLGETGRCRSAGSALASRIAD